MSAITDEIVAIETEINKCFDTDSPIDPKKLVRLYDLRVERAKELAAQHKLLTADRNVRIGIMNLRTRVMRDKLVFTPEQMSIRAGKLDALYVQIDKYDIAAVRWIDEADISWENSEANSLMAGILILADEIR